MSIDIPDFSQARILVVGDVMVDRYWYGGAHRISPEAPVPVVRVEDEELRPGGAGNVARNISALGAQVRLCAVTGEDAMAHALLERLEQENVECDFTRHGNFPTITKLRIISRHQQLIRLDFEDGFAGFDPADLFARFERQLADADLVVLSDYGKGTLREIERFIGLARSRNIPVMVDPKGADFQRYRGASLITPNLSEFEAAMGACADEAQLTEKGMRMLAECELDALLITRGEQGMTLLQRGRPAQRYPARSQEVFDVTGAGDTVIAVLASAVASGMPLDAATQLANVGAGVVVGRLGASTVSLDELKQAFRGQRTGQMGAVDEQTLLGEIELARKKGESIVFTNGCFDILHAGHVSYLEQASRLGDRLVVAVNVDETVRMLKGADRPVNTLSRRMAVLAALGCVDWVVPFAEATPERLICRIRPDYLVKGGDNDPDQIPGARCVREAGGEVAVMDFVDNCSTTGIIEAIRESEERRDGALA